MENATAWRIANRFAALAPHQRRDFLQKMQEQGVSFGQLPIPATAPTDAPCELSYAQQRQWFLWQLDPQGAAYHIPTALRLRGALNVEALQRSFDALLERHHSLRSVFVEPDPQAAGDDSQPPSRTFKVAASVQPLAASGPWLTLARHDLRDLPHHQRLDQALTLLEDDIARPFDLQHGPLLRVSLLQLDTDDHVLVLTLHHIVADGWSMGVLVDEFSQLYAAHAQGQSVTLPPLPIQYADYARWQRRWMEAGELERQLDWWRAQLGDEQPVLELPADRPRPAHPTQQGARLDFTLEPLLAKNLMALARQRGVTPFMLLLASFQALLHRYSGQPDLRIGVPVANRTRAETRGLIGFFVNTQVLRAELDGRMPFARLLEQTRDRSLDAQAYQEVPFERLVQALQGERSLSHSPLFQVMFNHQQSRPGALSAMLAGLQVEQVEWQGRTTQFDLQLDTHEEGECLMASLTYATDLFDAPRIERLAAHWRNLLAAIVADPDCAVGELPMLSAAEVESTCYRLNATEHRYPGPACVQLHFEANAAATPDACALVFGAQSLTYAALNRRANRLARRLREAGVGPEVRVGVACERSLELVIGLLAILKAGGAYVPLDPEYPAERLAYLFEDSAISLLLTQAHVQAHLPLPEGLPVVCVQADEAWLAGDEDGNLPNLACAQNLAYVIYTSGSTGRPKGAGNSHGALYNRLAWMQAAYDLKATDRVLQKTPFSFDVSVWEFF